MLSSLDADAHAVVFQIKTKKPNNYILLQNWWEFKVFSVPNTFRSGIYYALNFTWLWKKKKNLLSRADFATKETWNYFSSPVRF